MLFRSYQYEKAPDQEHFLRRSSAQKFFQAVLKDRKKEWKFNQSPLFLEFLMGNKNYQCTPWGNPTRNVFGWQKPCYLMTGEGYTNSFKSLMEETQWDNYGTGKHPKCADCMVHCGYEPTAVIDTFSSMKNLLQAARSSV